MWQALKQLFTLDEFVVNEQPLPVMSAGALLPAGMRQATGGAEDRQASGISVELDLKTQIENLLLEQVRLTEKAKHLESNRVGDDEFGRFARQALPFLDNFYRLLELARENPPSEEVDSWLRNVEALYFRLVNLLETYGFVFINSVGKKIDLDYHEVIEYRSSPDHAPDTVIRELQKGVVFRGRLLRDAKVIVAAN